MKERLILGTVQMGIDYGINNPNGKIPENESFDILRTAYASGISMLDTAEVYGNAHQLIGRFHAENPEQRFLVQTKFPNGIEAGEFIGQIKTYLSDLNIKQIETMMFHSFQSYLVNQKHIGMLDEAKKQGLIRKAGVSVYTNSEFEAVINDDQVDVIQLPFNLFDNLSFRGELMQKAKQRGKELHSRSAFLQGLFFLPPDSNHPVARMLKPNLDQVRKLSKDTGIQVHLLALAYCLHQKLIDRVIVGVDSADQLQKNLEASDIQLNDEIIRKVNSIRVSNPDLVNPKLWN
jgi:uncharacterized protein